ncbi:MAG: T9SS type A sorting domain-containing protein [Candidatus Kapabacteria bacterium]|jgi:hypothetical protein|nr:T9SS type A sorting domain-containing protein [Candidatus Kapabacteria bacterium]
MKKYSLSFLLMLIFSAFVVSNDVNAQDTIPPCDMDCLPQSPWNFATSIQYPVPGCPGCSLSFNYWWREDACGVWNDIQLGDVSITLGCLACPFTIKDYVDFARDKMIRDNPILKPVAPNCDIFWRAFTSSCWGKLVMGNDTLIQPCEPSQCCWEVLQVCGVIGGGINYTAIDTYSPDPEVCFIYPWPCTFTCNPPEPPTMPSGLEENINSESGYKTTVYPNPSNDWVNIKLMSESDGEHKVEIFDGTGNLIISKTFTKSQNEIYIQLNMSSFPTGNYSYIVKHDGKPAINGSFYIVK